MGAKHPSLLLPSWTSSSSKNVESGNHWYSMAFLCCLGALNALQSVETELQCGREDSENFRDRE